MSIFDYQFLNVLGTGSFGKVYKCRDATNNVCCVKKIKLDMTSAKIASQYQQMQQEVYLLQNLKHPHIIPMLTSFTEVNKNSVYIFIIMEYAEHGAVSALLQKRSQTNLQFEENDVIKYFIDILLGLEYLHMKNVIHQDLKSENILICANGRLKIADFGVSKIGHVDTETDLTNDEKGNGTPLYMSPETLLGYKFTFSSDIWAMGCLLYELCTFSTPFASAKDFKDLIHRSRCKFFQPINRSGKKNYSIELINLCDSMLNPDFNLRTKLKDIIANSLITQRYYHCYFLYNYD